jgi:predicted nucleic acid-binding protein
MAWAILDTNVYIDHWRGILGAEALLTVLGDEQGWDTAKRRDFQNDALIALTARSHGSAVVTTNRGDFELLARRLRIQVVVPDPARP